MSKEIELLSKATAVRAQKRNTSPVQLYLIGRLLRNRVFLFMSFLLLGICATAIFGSHFVRYDPNAQSLVNSFSAPSWDHWLGTDRFGRDIFARLVGGTRVAMFAGLESTLVAWLFGVPLGVFIGFKGGWWDRVAMRYVDMLSAVPPLITALVIIAIIGKGLVTGMFAIGFTLSTALLRVSRGATLEIREELFIDAARVNGLSTGTILWRHILPNIAEVLIVRTAHIFGLSLIAEASLSFIGLGAQPPTSSWGTMLADAAQYFGRYPEQAIAPGLAIAITVLAVNLLGDIVGENLGAGAKAGYLRVEPTSKGGPALFDPTASYLVEVCGLEVVSDSSDKSPTPILSTVDFTIRRGEVLGLVGESGSGKSVTSLALAGLLPSGVRISRGSFRLGGCELLGPQGVGFEHMRGKHIGFVFQDPMSSLNPSKTIYNQLAEPLLLAGVARDRIRTRVLEVLERVAIPDPDARLDSYPHEMSGGMAQRVAIAMALINEPELLIVDEPTTALDVTIQAQILDLLHRLKDELNLAILFITHDLGVVADICDRVAVMYCGQIVECAQADILFSKPVHPYTRGLLSIASQMESGGHVLKSIPGAMPTPDAWPGGCRFQPRCEQTTAACFLEIEMRPLAETQSVRCVLSIQEDKEVMA